MTFHPPVRSVDPVDAAVLKELSSGLFPYAYKSEPADQRSMRRGEVASRWETKERGKGTFGSLSRLHQLGAPKSDTYLFTIRAFSEQIIFGKNNKNCLVGQNQSEGPAFGQTPRPGLRPRVNRPFEPPRPVKGSSAKRRCPSRSSQSARGES